MSTIAIAIVARPLTLEREIKKRLMLKKAKKIKKIDNFIGSNRETSQLFCTLGAPIIFVYQKALI